MSSYNGQWADNDGGSYFSQYIALKEELRKKSQEIKELKESNESIKDLEGRIKALETQRDFLKERLSTVENELGLVKGKVDHLKKENANLEKRLKERNSLQSTPATVSEAYLYLGALCDGVQTMMYKHVFQRKSYPRLAVYKVKDIEHHLAKGGTIAKARWDELRKKLKWDQVRHLDAITHCKRSRNKCAHPDAQLTEESLAKSIELLKNEGELSSGWVSAETIEELKTMWKMLTTQQQW